MTVLWLHKLRLGHPTATCGKSATRGQGSHNNRNDSSTSLCGDNKAAFGVAVAGGDDLVLLSLHGLGVVLEFRREHWCHGMFEGLGESARDWLVHGFGEARGSAPSANAAEKVR